MLLQNRQQLLTGAIISPRELKRGLKPLLSTVPFPCQIRRHGIIPRGPEIRVELRADVLEVWVIIPGGEGIGLDGDFEGVLGVGVGVGGGGDDAGSFGGRWGNGFPWGGNRGRGGESPSSSSCACVCVCVH